MKERKFDDSTIARVCELAKRGLNPNQIIEEITKTTGNERIHLNHHQVYKVIAAAFTRKWLRYISPKDDSTSARLLGAYPHLKISTGAEVKALVTMEVTHGEAVDDVASHTAELIMEQLRAGAHSGKKTFHVGFSGGHTIRRVVEELAFLLQESTAGLPKKIVYHALVAGFDLYSPGSDPTSSFTYLSALKTNDLTLEFFLLHAPPVVRSSERDKWLSQGLIKTALQNLRLDLIVTSAADVNHEHSQLRNLFMQYNAEFEGTIEKMMEAGCVGDLLWLPVKNGGVLDPSQFPFRLMTLIELSGVQAYIKEGTKVILALGPCAARVEDGNDKYRLCGHARTEVLDAILSLKEDDRLITHLVIDQKTANTLLEKTQEQKVGTTTSG